MKKLLAFAFALTFLFMATVAEGSSFKRTDVNPPPNLVLQNSTINPAAVMTAEIHQAIGADVAVVIDNTLAVPAMPATRFRNTPINPILDIWVFYNRLSRPPLAASVTITRITEDYMIPRTGSMVFSPSHIRSFTSPC